MVLWNPFLREKSISTKAQGDVCEGNKKDRVRRTSVSVSFFLSGRCVDRLTMTTKCRFFGLESPNENINVWTRISTLAVSESLDQSQKRNTKPIMKSVGAVVLILPLLFLSVCLVSLLW